MRTSYLTIMTYVRSRIVNNTNFYKLFSDSLGEKPCCMRSDNLTTKRRSVQQLPIFMNEWMLDYKPTWVTRFLSNSCWDSVYFFIVCIFFFAKKCKKKFCSNLPRDCWSNQIFWENKDLVTRFGSSTMVLMFSMGVVLFPLAECTRTIWNCYSILSWGTAIWILYFLTL